MTEIEMKAYTIGHTKSYDTSLASSNPVHKIGRREEDDYAGGWVWLKYEEAESFLKADELMIDGVKRNTADFSIYELELTGDYNDNISMDVDKYGIHHLLHDARIKGKVVR